MERMAMVQKRLANALVILGEDTNLQERYIRVYNECLCHISMGDLPRVLRKDYYELLALIEKLHCDQESFNVQSVTNNTDNIQEMTVMLPVAILLLYKHLTEWMAVECYLRNQRHVYG